MCNTMLNMQCNVMLNIYGYKSIKYIVRLLVVSKVTQKKTLREPGNYHLIPMITEMDKNIVADDLA